MNVRLYGDASSHHNVRRGLLWLRRDVTVGGWQTGPGRRLTVVPSPRFIIRLLLCAMQLRGADPTRKCVVHVTSMTRAASAAADRGGVERFLLRRVSIICPLAFVAVIENKTRKKLEYFAHRKNGFDVDMPRRDISTT